MSKTERQNYKDFNIHGIVKVRFNPPDSNNVEKFKYRFGAVLAPPGDSQPDIVVNFSEKFDGLNLAYIGQNNAGFSSEDFYILDRTTGKVSVKILFDTIGNRREITYLQGDKSLSFLQEIINFTFLSKGYTPVHASGLIYQDIGLLIAGWPKGGKTGALLSLMNHGAQFVGDEWILVSSDGDEMLGFPTPISLSQWQLKYIPRYTPKIKPQQRFFFNGIRVFVALHAALRRTSLKSTYLYKMVDRALPYFKKQLKVSKSPQVLFKGQIGDFKAAPDKILLVIGHNQTNIKIEKSDPEEIALRMVQANEYELRDFLDYYKAFKFAFPGFQDDFLEDAFALQHSLLCQAFKGKEAYTVYHPYGESLELLFNKINTVCFKSREDAGSPTLIDVNLARTYEEVS